MVDIDIIIPWVNNKDSNWINEYNKYCPKEQIKEIDVSDKRYRDLGLLKYWFRGIEKFAPWVRKIHFVTNGQHPDWLNLNNPKLNFVTHDEYIPSVYLPVFSSHPIELMFHHIPDLSENFIYFNDDLYLIGSVEPDFFFKRNLPVDCGAFSIVSPAHKIRSIIYNDLSVINEQFTKSEYRGKSVNLRYALIDNLKSLLLKPFPFITGFLDSHCALSYKKSTFEEVWEKCPESLKKTMESRFRSLSDVNQWVFRYWRLCKGEFYPSNIRKGIKVCNINDDKIPDYIVSGKVKELIINDDDCDNFEFRMKKVSEAFEIILPEKSSFEI